MNKTTIQHFTDLNTWKKNHEFVKLVYEISKKFPTEEQFGLTNQLRRSASSVTANIAEGYGRYHLKDKIKFYHQARGSNTESQNHIILAFELNYLSEKDYNKLKIVVFEGYKLICGLIRSTSNQI